MLSRTLLVSLLTGCAGYQAPASTPLPPAQSDLATGMPAELVVPLGHEGPVRVVVASADGVLAASAGSDGTVRIWELGAGREVRVIRGVGAEVLAFTPDARVLALGGESLVLAKVSTGETVHPIQTEGPVRAVAFGKAGSWVGAAVGSRVQLFEVSSGAPVARLEGSAEITAMAFAPDRSLLAIGDVEGDVTLFDLGTGERLLTLGSWLSRLFGLGTHDSAVAGLAFSNDGAWLASVSQEGELLRTDVATAEVLGEARATDALGVSVAGDGRSVLVTTDGAVEGFDVPSYRRLFRQLIPGAKSSAAGVGLYVVAGDDLVMLDSQGGMKERLRGHATQIFELGQVSSSWILAGAASAGLLLLDTGAATTSVVELPGTTGADRHAGALRFTLAGPTLTLIEAGALGQKAAVLDLASTNPARVFPDDPFALEAVDVSASANGKVVAMLANLGIVLFEATSGRELIRFSVDRAVSKSGELIYTADSQRLAAIIDFRVRVYDGVEGRLIWRDARTTRDIAYTGDEELLVAAGPDGVALFAALDGKERGVLEHLDATAVATSKRDPRRVASGDANGEIRVFDTKEGLLRFKIERAHRGAVRALFYDDTKDVLLSTGEDGAAAVFRANDGREVLRLFRVGREDFLVTSPDGRFDVSEGVGSRVYSVRGAKSFDVSESSGRTKGLLAALLAELSGSK
ncbi:MAG: hypothetical protein HY791_00765 [Deltaproteobacteria bacterium]|nr:hypothetical protein [Deltaproteobacteria bacterium]